MAVVPVPGAGEDALVCVGCVVCGRKEGAVEVGWEGCRAIV
jgi:hypothetical protein